MYTRDQVRSCYSVAGGGLHGTLDDALDQADALNAELGVDEDGRGRAVIVPAMTIQYPTAGSNPTEPAPWPEPVETTTEPAEETPPDGTSTS